MAEIRQTLFFSRWFRSIRDRQAKFRIQARIDRLHTGYLGDTKSVGDGLMELRIFYGPGYRVYFIYKNDTLYLILGGDKKSQQKDVEVAKQLAKQIED